MRVKTLSLKTKTGNGNVLFFINKAHVTCKISDFISKSARLLYIFDGNSSFLSTLASYFIYSPNSSRGTSYLERNLKNWQFCLFLLTLYVKFVVIFKIKVWDYLIMVSLICVLSCLIMYLYEKNESECVTITYFRKLGPANVLWR